MTGIRRPPIGPRPCPDGEGGSIVLAMLVSMLALSIAGMLFTSIALSERNARQGRDFTTALETADAGVQHAVAQLNGGAGTPTPPAQPLEVGDATVTYTATPTTSSVGGAAWLITSTATSLFSGEQRRVVAVIEEESRFPYALFSNQSVNFVGANVIDSYSSGVVCAPLPSCAWAAPYRGGGIVATNDSLTFNGASTQADGAALYNWAADPRPVRCVHTGGSSSTSQPCSNLRYHNERLDLTSADATEFLEDLEDDCNAIGWTNYRTSLDLNVPAVLTSGLHCFSDVVFDVDTVLVPVTTEPLDIAPVVIVVRQGGTVTVENGVDVNCLAPCLRGTSIPAAPHLQIYSLSTTNMLSVGVGSSFAGTVYAPLAGCVSPTSSAQADIYGSLVCNDAGRTNGGWNLHYDRALGGLGTGRFLVREWREEPV